MGADYYARTIVGCEVPHAKLYDKDGTELVVNFADDQKVGPLVAYSTTDNERWFVGIASARVESEILGEASMLRPLDGVALFGPAPSMEATVRATLEPLGMWDPDTFGIWCVMHCSY